MTRRGFTLMETLVVITIIAVLAGIAYPVSRSAIGKSREAACLAQLRPLGVALQTHLQEHADTMPVMDDLRASKSDDVPVMDTVLAPYVDSPGAFHCPADGHLHEKSGSSYWWNSAQSGRHVTKLFFFGMRTETIPLISDKESWHPSGTNILYADLSASNKIRFTTGN